MSGCKLIVGPMSSHLLPNLHTHKSDEANLQAPFHQLFPAMWVLHQETSSSHARALCCPSAAATTWMDVQTVVWSLIIPYTFPQLWIDLCNKVDPRAA